MSNTEKIFWNIAGATLLWITSGRTGKQKQRKKKTVKKCMRFDEHLRNNMIKLEKCKLTTLF